MSDTSNTERRRRRVKRLKRMIVGTFVVMITFPTAFSIYVGCKLHVTNNNLAEMTSQYEAQLGITGELQEKLSEEIKQREIAEAEVAEAAVSINIEQHEEINSFVEQDNTKKVYLTFDDGPSIYTGQILDILDQYGVKATFFVTGEHSDYEEMFKEIVNRGHSIGMHSNTHIYSEIYKSKENFEKDFFAIRDYIMKTTGVNPVIYRFPGGSSNTVSATDMEELCRFVEEQGVTYFDWNVSSGDATSQTLSAARIVANCMAGINNYQESVILMHDTSAKYSTVAALPVLIEQIQAMEDVEILPITEDTEAVQHKTSE
ncbi:MAG: polysaccharide deacetylase [Lachnospiraceae bacterium]|nr:polysaccharide deacetylase [Candidatus Colinaster scatohippi]